MLFLTNYEIQYEVLKKKNRWCSYPLPAILGGEVSSRDLGDDVAVVSIYKREQFYGV